MTETLIQIAYVIFVRGTITKIKKKISNVKFSNMLHAKTVNHIVFTFTSTRNVFINIYIFLTLVLCRKYEIWSKHGRLKIRTIIQLLLFTDNIYNRILQD